MRKSFLFCVFTLVFPIVVFAQSGETGSVANWVEELQVYAKVFGAIIAALGSLFGLPASLLYFKKTRAEIRKLEAEANALSAKSGELKQTESYANRIEINDSHSINIEILADPRFLGPLLLLLDFIIAWIILTLSNYALGFFIPFFKRELLILIAILLLIPIFLEARRVKKVLIKVTNAQSDVT